MQVNVPYSKPLNLVIEKKQTFKISGKVLDVAGSPMPNVYLEFKRKSDKFYMNQAKCNSAGEFSALDFPSGDYDVTVYEKRESRLHPIFNVKVANSDVTDLVLRAKKIVKGGLVRKVFPGGKAEKAGIKVGDVILEYNGKKINPTVLIHREGLKAIGSAPTVPVLLFRNGKEMTVMIEPGDPDMICK